LTTVMLVVVCGALVATATLGPLRFDDFLPPAVSAAVSVGIGIAGALASLDDVGKRELLGLATAAQVGVVPAWLGISLVRGFDVSPAPRLLAYLAGLAIIAITAALVYGAVRMRRRTTQPRRSSPSPLSTTDSQHVGRP
jgi:hypothetical protein